SARSLLGPADPEPSRTQHWSHGWYPGGTARRCCQELHVPWARGCSLGSPWGGSLAQIAQGLPSLALARPEDAVPMAQGSLHRKQTPGTDTAGEWDERLPALKTTHWRGWRCRIAGKAATCSASIPYGHLF
uniref:Progonadoliberin n=1 Tax=Oryctolagus cuniculus TaxID=9986 RepID=A0A5F9DGC6_RABIT